MADLSLASGAEDATNGVTMNPSMHTASRVILTTPRAIFRAFVDPEAFVNWRAPKGMTAIVRGFDPRPGGGYQMVLTYDDPSGAPGKTDGAIDIVNARFLELDPDARIVEAITFESDDLAFAGTMTLTTTIGAVNGGTKVSFVAVNVPRGISTEDHRKGMESSLKNLASLLE